MSRAIRKTAHTGTKLETWHSPARAGALLGYSDQWVRNQIRSGAIAAIRTSTKNFVVSQSEIDRLLEEMANK